MEITSIAGVWKIFIPALPYLKKLFIFDTFFSLSYEKKAEAITYLTECGDEEEILEKYKQELKLSEYKMSGNYLLNVHILKYYILNPAKHKKFCKSLFLFKGFYKYHDHEVTIKKNVIWIIILMFIIGFIAGAGALFSWATITSTPLKWTYSVGGLIIFTQYVFYSLYMLFCYISLRRNAIKFNVFISILRIKKALSGNNIA